MRNVLIIAGLLAASPLGLQAQTPQAPVAVPVTPTAAQAPPPSTPPGAQRGRGTTPMPPVAIAQTVAPAGQAPTPASAGMSSASSWQNVSLEFTITDTFAKTPSKKTVTMLVADHGTGRIRSSMQIQVRTDNGPSG